MELRATTRAHWANGGVTLCWEEHTAMRRLVFNIRPEPMPERAVRNQPSKRRAHSNLAMEVRNERYLAPRSHPLVRIEELGLRR